MWFTNKKKRRIPEPELHRSVKSATTKNQTPLNSFRDQILAWMAVVIIIITGVVIVYGPWFKIINLEITGTQIVDPASVRQVAEHLLNQPQWLIVPRRNLLLLVETDLARRLQNKIETKVAIEGINITKIYYHAITIEVIERTPLFIWTSAGQQGRVDRHGVIVDLAVKDTGLVVLSNENNVPFSVGQVVVKEEVITASQNIKSALAQSGFLIKSLSIPVPSCPITTSIENTNLNINTNNNLNMAAPFVEFYNTNTSTNINAAVSVPCQPDQLALASPEIHVQIEGGPRVLFDRHQNIAIAVQTLRRIMTTEATRGAKVVDVRFEGRVYIQ